MALKKGEEYIASLKSLGLEANVMGKKTQVLPDHPLVTPSVRAVASTFGTKDLPGGNILIDTPCLMGY